MLTCLLLLSLFTTYSQAESPAPTLDQQEQAVKIFFSNPTFFDSSTEPYDRLITGEAMSKKLNSLPPRIRANLFIEMLDQHPDSISIHQVFGSYLKSLAQSTEQHFEEISILLDSPEKLNVLRGGEFPFATLMNSIGAGKDSFKPEQIEQLVSKIKRMPVPARALAWAHLEPLSEDGIKAVQSMAWEEMTHHSGNFSINFKKTLKDHDYNFSPAAKNRFDVSMRKLIEERLIQMQNNGRGTLGAFTYQKLARANPELAAKYADTYLVKDAEYMVGINMPQKMRELVFDPHLEPSLAFALKHSSEEAKKMFYADISEKHFATEPDFLIKTLLAQAPKDSLIKARLGTELASRTNTFQGSEKALRTLFEEGEVSQNLFDQRDRILNQLLTKRGPVMEEELQRWTLLHMKEYENASIRKFVKPEVLTDMHEALLRKIDYRFKDGFGENERLKKAVTDFREQHGPFPDYCHLNNILITWFRH